MIRIFVGLGLPPEISQKLSALSSGVENARWVAPENQHITLRFIGEVEPPMAEDIDAALGQIREPAFDLSLDGLGVFQSGQRVRAIWAAVTPAEAITHLSASVESALVRAGLDAENRKFKPHVTMARLRGGRTHHVEPYMEANAAFRAGLFAVTHFTLFRSHLGQGGAHYETLAEYPLVADTPTS